MANYRCVLRHARFWRGAVHRWSTSYEFTGGTSVPDAAACDLMALNENKLLYCPTTAGSVGGVSEVAFYSTSGGVPVAEKIYYDYTTPGSWLPPSSSAWPTRTAANDEVAENAFVIEWAGGLSSSGKPVKFRKWYHSIPISQGVGNTADIPVPTQTSLLTQATVLQGCLAGGYGLVLGNARRLAGVASILPYYQNHQMPRGRRRKPLVTADGRYTGPSLLIGPGAAGEGGD